MWMNYQLANHQAQKYIRGIRNSQKKSYAVNYWAYLSAHTRVEPIHELTYMGAQAVRMQLDSIRLANWQEVSR
jgi:hypothetical protein